VGFRQGRLASPDRGVPESGLPPLRNGGFPPAGGLPFAGPALEESRDWGLRPPGVRPGRDPGSRLSANSTPCVLVSVLGFDTALAGLLNHRGDTALAGLLSHRGEKRPLNAKRPPNNGWPIHKEVRRCPTLPQGPPCSTIGAEGLSFRVRNVTGRFPFAMAAETLLICVVCGSVELSSGFRP
jgi:hypothetical protein